MAMADEPTTKRLMPLSARATWAMMAVVLMAPLVVDKVVAEPAPHKPYCMAGICAPSQDLAAARLTGGPGYVQHTFTMRDGSKAEVRVSTDPQAPEADALTTRLAIDGAACRRVDLGGGPRPQIGVFCDWRLAGEADAGSIHAWTEAGNPEASEAWALLRNLRRCDKARSCPLQKG